VRSLRSGHVMVVNDDPATLRETSRLLAREGLVVSCYGSASDALRALAQNGHVDLVITDLCMPGMDGWHFTRLIRSCIDPERHNGPVPVLLVSSTFSGSDAEQISVASGADKFLDSYEPHGLIGAVEQLLERRYEPRRRRAIVVAALAGSHASLLDAFRAFGYLAIEGCGEQAAREMLSAHRPDVLLLDYEAVTTWGSNLAAAPNGADRAGIVVVCNVPRALDIESILGTPADEYLVEDRDPDEAVRICHAVHRERSMMKVVQQLEERTRRAQEGEERYRELFDSAHDLILSWSADGRFLLANPAWTDATGYGTDDMRRMSVFDVVHPAFRAQFRALHEGIMAGHPTDGAEITLLSKERRTIVVEGDLSCRSHDGDRATILAVMRDVTERRSLELQLIQAQKMEALGTLAGGIAHDFSNLLTAVTGLGELVLLDLEPDSVARTYVSGIIEQGKRGARLVHSLLTFSRRSAPEKRPVNLRSILLETLSVLRRTVPENVDVKWNLAEGGGTSNADASQITQVIMNLCLNAVQAMPSGGTLTVDMDDVTIADRAASTTAPHGRYVRLRVRDTGVGMTPEVQKRIFEPFFTTKPEGVGTGLGLSIVYGIVESHEGHICVESAPGEGTVFEIHLPALDVAAIEPPAPVISPIGGSAKILLVEDEPPVLLTTRSMLERLGYEVATACDGEEALIAYKALAERQTPPSLVITDIVMPRMGGYELYDRLLEIDSDIRVLFVSGHSQMEGPASRHRANYRGLVRKPFEYVRLAEAVDQALS